MFVSYMLQLEHFFSAFGIMYDKSISTSFCFRLNMKFTTGHVAMQIDLLNVAKTIFPKAKTQ